MFLLYLCIYLHYFHIIAYLITNQLAYNALYFAKDLQKRIITFSGVAPLINTYANIYKWFKLY